MRVLVQDHSKMFYISYFVKVFHVVSVLYILSLLSVKCASVKLASEMMQL